MTDAWKQQEGQIVDGRFRLIQYLGGTDSSAVFLTESGKNRDRVAIKLIGADPTDADSQLSRLRRAAKLLHPHLARIFEAGRAQVGSASVVYIITEYAEEDLAQILPDRALTPEEVRDMLPFIIDALQFLHSHGFVHARLKPSNVLAVNDQLKLSLDGVCATGERGAPGEKATAYDPPELAPNGPSPAGDVWSLGMTIVEILTRRLPVWEWTGHADPPAPRNLPAPFLEIVRNCLRRDPAMRCTLREISENLDPQPAARVGSPRSTALTPPIAAPSTQVTSDSKAFYEDRIETAIAVRCAWRSRFAQVEFTLRCAGSGFRRRARGRDHCPAAFPSSTSAPGFRPDRSGNADSREAVIDAGSDCGSRPAKNRFEARFENRLENRSHPRSSHEDTPRLFPRQPRELSIQLFRRLRRRPLQSPRQRRQSRQRYHPREPFVAKLFTRCCPMFRRKRETRSAAKSA